MKSNQLIGCNCSYCRQKVGPLKLVAAIALIGVLSAVLLAVTR